MSSKETFTNSCGGRLTSLSHLFPSLLPLPPDGTQIEFLNNNHYKEAYIHMVLGEGICPSQGRQAEKG